MGEVNVGSGGAKEFRDLADDLRKAGAKGLQRKLYAGLFRSVRPITDAARESARSTLPSSGGKDVRRTRLVRTGTKTIEGVDYVTRRRVAMSTTRENESLAERVSKARYTARALRGKNVGIRITATAKGGAKVDLNALDEGIVRHQLYGNRKHWFQQRVTPRWFSRPAETKAPQVEAELSKAVEEFIRDLEKK